MTIDMASMNQEDPTVVVDETDLPSPYDVGASIPPQGGWLVAITWEYGYRIPDVHHFDIYRQISGCSDWTKLEPGIDPDKRESTLKVDDGQECRFIVSAVGKNGMVSDSEPSAWVRADTSSLIPTGIRKAFPSTSRKIFIVWDYVPQAAGYLVEAVDKDGCVYLTTKVSDPKAPYTLLEGVHPEDSFTARVTTLTELQGGAGLGGTLSAEEHIVLDKMTSLQWGVFPLTDPKSDDVPPFTQGVILLLCADDTPSVHVGIDSYAYEGPWDNRNGHKSAAISYSVPSSDPIRVYVRISPPSSAHQD